MSGKPLNDGLTPLDVGPMGGNDPALRSFASLSDLWTPEQKPASQPVAKAELGQMLLDLGAVDAATLTNARSVVAKSPGRTLAQVLLEHAVDEEAIQRCVAQLHDLPFERVDLDRVDTRLFKKLGSEFCKTNGVLPLRVVSGRLFLGISKPDDLILIDEVRHKTGMAVKPVVICMVDVEAAAEALRDDQNENQAAEVDSIIAGVEEDDVEVVQTKEEEVDLEKMAGESPIIRLVNYLIFNAVKEGASDIHIEPHEKKLQVRYRIDGVLFETTSPPYQMHAAIVSRLKIMANLDISERRLPQDGRIRAMVHGRKLDLRMSTLPTAQGEKVVLRILDTRSINVPLENLGMDEDQLLIWKHHIDQPHGIILVTGPTGSGKTTTLYASLSQMDRKQLNISTVEDPVEYHLGGITQVQTHERIGMTFAAALRSLLRQDPDVIMLGEIRDAETAKIAIQASLTGHLVLSTLHTNDAPSSVTRLINIGVEPYLIGAALNACLAQRLVRKICPHCKTQAPVNEKFLDHLAMHGIALDNMTIGKGCDRCRNTGYSGRLGLYELLVLDDTLRDKVAGNPNVSEFRRICVERGMVSLREDGFRKAAAGLTTVDEVLRVTEATI